VVDKDQRECYCPICIDILSVLFVNTYVTHVCICITMIFELHYHDASVITWL